MSTLPAAVRLSLWATSAWAGHVDLDEALRRALPDVDDVSGDLERLATWQDLGERVLACALPRAGDVTGLPRGNPDLTAAAIDAGECVFVPALGGALVPTVSTYGAAGDEGTAVRLTAYDCAPTPVHRLEELHESQIERVLRQRLAESTQLLLDLDVQPWAGSPLRAMADDRVALRQWGLPPGLPGRALRILQTAGTVGAAMDLALEHSPAVDSATDEARHRVLRDLQAEADVAMAQATTIAALGLAGLRPGGPD